MITHFFVNFIHLNITIIKNNIKLFSKQGFNTFSSEKKRLACKELDKTFLGLPEILFFFQLRKCCF